MTLLWYTRCPAPTPFGIAAQQGLLKEEFAADGIEVKALQDADDPAIRRSHFTHTQPWSFRQGGNIPALWARAQGSDTRLIGISWVDEFQALITLDPRLKATRASLAGRRLGLPINTAAEVVDFHRATALRGFHTLLEAIGASPADVQLVDLPHAPRGLAHAKAHDAAPLAEWLDTQRAHEFSREAAALLRGEADVVFVKGATGLDIANVLGARVLIDISAHPDRRAHANNGTPRPLTVDAQLLRERPDLVERVLARTLDVAAWAGAHPGEVTRYVGREVRSAEHWVTRAYPAGLHRQLGIGLDAAALDALEHFKHFLFEHGFIPTDFDFARWVEPAPLEAALARHAQRAAAIAA
ncbi:ABC-type nitrate/sulfonate/bicarbonate transport system substrate-binding protein [Paraburkholderia silvatlantica]|uniref:ABC-type nitrate/sulfonate/bicarbonate transport system substrate-binding protein n=1 Tax=Paraburkholderia silvatlantica TaxID=321895 RepID=A0A2V4TRT8_9BURK|nr:ABC transporter substrate-binding protein [Paraburkholderia silvatlantica]PYE20597.1 ABC-type nitrate/sulfonate/bicarbonate transport system substrate-binding protein [Paraburkholderia silvatlantica]